MSLLFRLSEGQLCDQGCSYATKDVAMSIEIAGYNDDGLTYSWCLE